MPGADLSAQPQFSLHSINSYSTSPRHPVFTYKTRKREKPLLLTKEKCIYFYSGIP